MIVLPLIMAVNVFALERKDVMPLIEEASGKRESAYVEVRNRIVGYGTNAIPILGSVAVDESLPWQQKLIARICYERIEREKEIKKILETDWYKHPNFNPRWNEYLGGPEGRMHDMVETDLKEAGLWYYYLEVEWKMTGEQAEIRRNREHWISWCTFSVKDNPDERIWFLRICSEIMAIVPPSRRWDEWLRPILQREVQPDSAYLLEHRAPPPVTSEPPFRLGTNIVKRINQP